MSTQPQGFGQQGPFGAPPAPEPVAAAPEPESGSRRTLLIAGGAGVLALAVLGGAAALVGAAAIGLALAAGVTLGEYLGRPVSGVRDRYDERVRRRALTTD